MKDFLELQKERGTLEIIQFNLLYKNRTFLPGSNKVTVSENAEWKKQWVVLLQKANTVGPPYPKVPHPQIQLIAE